MRSCLPMGVTLITSCNYFTSTYFYFSVFWICLVINLFLSNRISCLLSTISFSCLALSNSCSNWETFMHINFEPLSFDTWEMVRAWLTIALQSTMVLIYCSYFARNSSFKNFIWLCVLFSFFFLKLDKSFHFLELHLSLFSPFKVLY